MSIKESLQILQDVALDDIIHSDTQSERDYFLGRMVAFKIAQRVIDSEIE